MGGISQQIHHPSTARKIMSEQAREIREAYDRVFSDESIVKEQIDTAAGFEGFGKDEGQEW
jgi:hypothetical protein